MSKRYMFKTEEGSVIVPVSVDGYAFTDVVDYAYGSQYELYVEFYSDPDGKVPVTPTGGEVSLSATPLGNNYLNAPNGIKILASEASFPESLYEPICLDGLVRRARVNFTGITGAPYMKAVLFARYGD